MQKPIYIVKGDTYNGLPCEYIYDNLAEAEQKYDSIHTLAYKSLCVEDEHGNRVLKRNTNDMEGVVLNGHEN